MPAKDKFGRPLRDLRISVTDRCNFRCTYCMPREVFGSAYHFLPRAEILSFEEIARLVRVLQSLGLEKVRITGGEPLLRRDLERLIEMLAASGIEDLALTTNGSLLAAKARALKAAGLHRVTVSLDALDRPTFQKMSDSSLAPEAVVQGIATAAAAGFAPVKINAVIRRGVNEHALLDLARRFQGPEYILRFIEYMDVGNTNQWRSAEVVSAEEMAAILQEEFALTPLPANYLGEVARRYRHDAGGEIGIISSITQPFCRDCTRARVSADGRLYTCLFATRSHDLRELLRSGAPDAEVRQRLAEIWGARDDRYSELRDALSTTAQAKPEMSLVGG